MRGGVFGDGMLPSGGWQLRRIHFVVARQLDAHSSNPAELGLIPLNDAVEPGGSMVRPPGKATAKNGKLHAKELFSESDVLLHWSTVRKTGAGLQNLGNTCFMNSVLQCLTHTPPLAELFLSSRTLSAGASNGFDPLGITRDLMQRSLQHRGPIVSPVAHAKSLRRICRSFRLGRQEDAHEYLVALLDGIHESSIAGLSPKPAPELAQTSFIYRIFAGKIRSQVKCSQCGYESNTYDPFLDLSLEITRANTVERALERFTAGEVLDGANKYKCSREAKPVRAVKRMTIHEAPNVLVLQLKRFEFSMSGHKISKKVDFSTSLDLSPYMSKRPAVPAMYDLYGVLVHSGHSVHSGHYFCFVRSGTGMWHICDDTQVSQVSERMVLGQKAYMLFYIKRAPSRRPFSAPATAGVAAAAAAVAAPSPSPPLKAANPYQQQQQQQQRQQQQSPAAAVPQGCSAAAQAAAAVPQAAGNQPLQEPSQRRLSQAQPSQQQQQQQQPAGKAGGKRKEPPAGSAGEAAAPGATRPAAANAGKRQKAPAAAPSLEGPAAAAGPPSPTGPEQQQQQQAGPSRKGKSAPDHPQSPAVTRLRLRARGASLLTPSKGLEAAALLSRRELRLHEVTALHRTINMARQLRRHLAQRQQQKQKRGAESAAAGGSPSASPPPAAAAPTSKAARKASRRVPAGAAAAGAGPANGADSSPSTTSTVTAPEWPPVKAPASAEQHKQQQQAAAGTSGGSSKRDVRAFLQQAAGGRVGLAVEQWDTVDLETKRQHDRMLLKAGTKRKAPDEYDMEYDQGRVKKVRNKDEAYGSQLDSAVFDAAWQDKRRGDGGPGGASNPVQFRGNKKKRQEQQQRRR